MNANSVQIDKESKGILNFKLSILAQLYSGAVFLVFAAGLLISMPIANKESYFIDILMIISLLGVFPILVVFEKCHIKIRNKKEKKNLIDTKELILTLLFAEFYRRIGLLDNLGIFLGINSVASSFALLLPFFAFFFKKTNLVIETIIFLLGLIILNTFGSKINLNHLVLFYSFIGIIFLTGGIIDLRKLFKISEGTTSPAQIA